MLEDKKCNMLSNAPFFYHFKHRNDFKFDHKSTAWGYPIQKVPRINPTTGLNVSSSQEFIVDNKINHWFQKVNEIGVKATLFFE